jgi:hypothetical protein
MQDLAIRVVPVALAFTGGVATGTAVDGRGADPTVTFRAQHPAVTAQTGIELVDPLQGLGHRSAALGRRRWDWERNCVELSRRGCAFRR